MEHRKEVPPCGVGSPQPLSAQEVSSLKRVGLLVESHHAPQSAARDAFDEVFGSALPFSMARELLHATIEDLQHRIDERTLLSVSNGKEVRIPVVQFYQCGELPGLRSVLSAISPDVSPMLIALWLAAPDPDLGGVDSNDEVLPSVSPRDFLLRGEDSAPLITKARHLASCTAI